MLPGQRDLVQATADIAAGRENVARAQRVLAIAQDRYAAGAAIQLEVLEAQGCALTCSEPSTHTAPPRSSCDEPSASRRMRRSR